MRAVTLLAGSLVAAALALAHSAQADEPSVSVTARLNWRREPGGQGCLDGAALTSAVNQRWRRRIFVEREDVDIVLSGAIGLTERGAWLARIELQRANGTSLGSRELTSVAADCSSLDDSIALAVGLMLDVSRRRIVLERAGGPAESVLGGAPISVPKETPPARASWRTTASASAEGALGILREPILGARFGVAFDPPRFIRVEAAAELWAKTRDEGAQGAHWALVTAELALCPLGTQRGGFDFYGCVAQRFGMIRATAFGFAENGAAAEPFWTVGARAVGAFHLTSRISLRLSVGADVPLIRYRFVYGDTEGQSQTVYRMAALSGATTLGLAATF